MTEPEPIDPSYGRRTRPGELPALRRAIAEAERLIRAEIRRTIPEAGLFSFGAVDAFPGALAIWVTTRTDAERDRLLRDPGFEPKMRALLGQAGYPADCVGYAGFTAESEETVERDYKGNWYWAVK